MAKERRLSCEITGRNSAAGNASGALTNTWVYEASWLQSATVASQARMANDRRAVKRFCPPGSGSPAIAGRSIALTFTDATSAGVSPARSTVTLAPATAVSDAQSVGLVSSPILARLTLSAVMIAPDAVEAGW